MSNFPPHIEANIRQDPNYYSLDVAENIARCKEDSEYLGEVVLANENLIWHCVHKYVGKPEKLTISYRVDKDDILQTGRLGLLKAIASFDPARGVRFSSFSVPAIVREIRVFLRDKTGMIRLTRSAHELAKRIRALEVDLGYLPSVPDIAVLLDEREDRIQKLLQVGRNVVYMETTELGPRYKKDKLTDHTANIESDVMDRILIDSVIEKIKDKLTETELEAFKDRIEGYNLSQIASKINVSQSKVSRMMKKVASLLRDIHEEIKTHE